MQKSSPNTDSSSPTLKEKKTKKLPKKYLQLNRTVTIPRGSPVEESRLNKKIADSNESSTPGRYSEILNESQPKPKNESLSIEPSSNIYSESTEKPENRREWNINSSVQTVSPFIPQSNNNNSYNAFNVNNLNNLNLPSDRNTVQSRYNRMPRPFSVLRSPDSPVTEIPYGKPSPSPANFNRQQVARSSANVLPLILPTETLFNTPSARRYVAINHLKPEGDSTTHVNTEASPSTNSASERTTFADHGVPYTGVIGTKSPLITVNNQRRISSSDYYAITENPAKQIATKTDSARLIHIPSQISNSYTLQQEKDPQAIRRDGFLPRITAYNDPKDEKSNLNSNAGLALYNKFESMYSVNQPNVFNVPRTVTQNYQNFGQPVQSLHGVTSQYVSTPLYATSKPISTPLLKIRPIASVKPALAPYYNNGLLVSQRTEGKEFNDNKKNAENVEINESRAADVDESNTEASDNENNFENHKAEINDRTYKNYKTSNERDREDREEEDREDRYQQPKRNYGYQDKYYEDDKDNKDDKNDDKGEKYNIRHKDNKDEEEDVDETQEDEYVNTGKNEDQPNHGHRYQYNKHKYDRDDSEEEERDKQRYDRKKYDKENNRRDEHDHETDVKDKFLSVNKYFDDKYFPRYSDYESREPDEKYRERYDRKKLSRDKKDRDEDSEDESFDEDKLIPRRSKDERAHRQREEYEKKQSKDDKTTEKHKYHRHHQAIPRRDSHHEEHKHEEYGETNPKYVHEEHRHLRQHVKDDDRHDSENDNEKTRDHEHGETQEHAHKHEEHHEKKKDGGDHEFEEGGGAEHKEEHHGHDGEKGHKVNYSDIAFFYCIIKFIPSFTNLTNNKFPLTFTGL